LLPPTYSPYKTYRPDQYPASRAGGSPAVRRGLAPSDILTLQELSAGLTPSRTEVSYSLRHTHLTRVSGWADTQPYGGGIAPSACLFQDLADESEFSRTEGACSLRYPRPKRFIGWTKAQPYGGGIAPSDILTLQDLSTRPIPCFAGRWKSSRTEGARSLRLPFSRLSG